MAIMCEQRVTLPPISSLDFSYSAPRNAQPWYGREDPARGLEPSSRPPSSHYSHRNWDARHPPPSGHPLSDQVIVRDGRPHPDAYDIQAGLGLPSAASNAPLRAPSHRYEDLRTGSLPAVGSPDNRHSSRVSHARNSSQISATSADSWSQYDSEHPDSPDVRMRSLSPGIATRAPDMPEAEPEVRFIYAALGGSRPAGTLKKRKVEDGSSGDDAGGNDAEGNKGVQHEKADGKRKYKKMMNVRHYRAQTKDALQNLRDVLPEGIRPLERQARSFTVVNAVKHIEDLTAQLERTRRENREQAEKLELANKREQALSAKIIELEQMLAGKEEEGAIDHHQRVLVTQHEGRNA